MTTKQSLRLKIDQFSKFVVGQQRTSEPVVIQHLPWNITVKQESDENPLHPIALLCSVQCNGDCSDTLWSCVASVVFRVVAQEKGKQDFVGPKTNNHTFKAKQNTVHWDILQQMTSIEDLKNPEKGWYDKKDDTIIVEAELEVDNPHCLRLSLVDRMNNLLNGGEESSDVHFLVGNENGEKEHFLAHKCVITTASDVFKAMFHHDDSRATSAGGIKKITDMKPETFRVMLNYIYTENLDGLNQDNVFDVLYAARKYEIAGLIKACMDCPQLEVNNVLSVLGKARLYEVEGLENRCFAFIDQNGVLESDGFMEIDQALLRDLLARDKLNTPNVPNLLGTLAPSNSSEREIAIWKSALRWADDRCLKHEFELSGENRRKMLGPALFNIRFPLIEAGDFCSIIVPSGVLTDQEVISIALYHMHPTKSIPDAFPLLFSAKDRA